MTLYSQSTTTTADTLVTEQAFSSSDVGGTFPILAADPFKSGILAAQDAFNNFLADWHVRQAASWSELKDAHDRWVVDFNYQSHWAHRERGDGRHSPAEVLGWVSGRQFSAEELHWAFYATRFGRRLNRTGYLRFRHWRLYGERGLAGEQVAVWLYSEQLTVAFADESLAQYQVKYQPDQRQFMKVLEEQLFETPYRSP